MGDWEPNDEKVTREKQGALARLREELTGRGLTLHPSKTRVVDTSQPGGFDFLGYHFVNDRPNSEETSHRGLRREVAMLPEVS